MNVAPRTHRRLCLEQLERRELLSVTQAELPIVNEQTLGIQTDVRGQIEMDDSGRIIIHGTDQADRVDVKLHGERVRVRLDAPSEKLRSVFDRAAVTEIVFAGWDGDDVFLNQTDIASVTLGHAGDDRLHGGSAVDQFRGGDGDDRIRGHAGDDQIAGEGGNDHLFGGPGSDILDGGDGNDGLAGGDENDELFGGQGDDLLTGQAGNDFLVDLDGDNMLKGGGGNDRINGNGGMVRGGPGDDAISGGRQSRIYGGDGDDQIVFLRNVTVRAGAGNDNIRSAGSEDACVDRDGSIVTTGAAVSDDGMNRIHAGPGDDTVALFDNDDLINGGEGNNDITRDRVS